MSKLNEEILDTLYDARFQLEYALQHFKSEDDEPNTRLTADKLARLNRVWDYFLAQRTIEEYRREDA